MLKAFAGVLGLLCAVSCTNSTAKGPAASVPVRVVQSTERPVPVEIAAVGNVEPWTTVVVRSPIGGTIVKMPFKDGDVVKRGDILFEIDSRTHQSAVRMWEANLGREKALLAQSEANLARAQAQEAHFGKQAERYARLFEQGIVSRELADQTEVEARARRTAVRAEMAAIESVKAAVAADEASLANAKLTLSYCTVKALVSGRTGSIRVKEGNLIKAAETELVTIHQIQPVYVAFSVPEENLLDIRRRASAGPLAVSAAIPGDSRAAANGTLTFLENSVDSSTGTIRLRATLENGDSRFWPGQFVDVRMRIEERPRAVVVPAVALQTGQQGNYVYVVRPDKTVELRVVNPGPRLESLISIQQGLGAGETVVTEGQLRLAPGMKIKVL
jgi:multidrug efflux system membrane fusion protein